MTRVKRASLTVDGPRLAKPGKDVDTAAIGDMLFDPRFIALRLAATGIVTPVPYSGSGQLPIMYDRAIVTFSDIGLAFSEPPVALVAGINADGSTDQSPIFATGADGSNAWIYPLYNISTFVDRLELYVIKESHYRPKPPTWRYFIFQNTLS